jgi:hypothetical protein
MAEMQKDEYKFPDETQDVADNIEIEIEDDTPLEDRNQTPMPKEIVDEIDKDDLERFSGQAKERLLQMKKVMNDERRAKDVALKNEQEAIRLTQAMIDENQQLKGRLSQGEKSLVSSFKENVTRELELAKREYKEAYDSGDSDRLVEANDKLTDLKLKAQQVEQYRPEFDEETLRKQENSVQMQQQPQKLDSKTQSWLDKNSWYGVDDDMSYLAHGIHRRLEREGVPIGSDHYWATIDAEVHKRFPEKFMEDDKESSDVEIKPSTKKPATVVAPATRSTSSKKITLSPRQMQLAKKFNLTNEQYARELNKLESQNG